MKNKIVMLLVLIVLMISLSGCGNSVAKTLNCIASDESDGRITDSTLQIKVKDDKIVDMKLTMEITIPREQQSYKQAMISQIRQKTNQVYSTDRGVKAIFGMNDSYFETLGLTQNASYGEIKQVFEIQGYTCSNE